MIVHTHKSILNEEDICKHRQNIIINLCYNLFVSGCSIVFENVVNYMIFT